MQLPNLLAATLQNVQLPVISSSECRQQLSAFNVGAPICNYASSSFHPLFRPTSLHSFPARTLTRHVMLAPQTPIHLVSPEVKRNKAKRTERRLFQLQQFINDTHASVRQYGLRDWADQCGLCVQATAPTAQYM